MKGLHIGRSPAYSAEMIPDPLLPRLPQQLPALCRASQKLARIWLAPQALGSIRPQYHRPRSRGRAAGWVGSPAARPWPRNRACTSATSARCSSASARNARLSSAAAPAHPARAAGQGGPSGISIWALIGQERRVLTLQGGESPMPDSGCPVAPDDGGRNVAEPSARASASVPCPAGRHWRTAAAWPRRCRRRAACPTDRRVDGHCGGRRLRRDQDVVADGRQQPGQRHRGSAQGCDRHRVPDPPPRWPGGAGDPTKLASIVGAGFSLAEPSGDASTKPSQPSGGKQ
jgi:hypothetical protein